MGFIFLENHWDHNWDIPCGNQTLLAGRSPEKNEVSTMGKSSRNGGISQLSKPIGTIQTMRNIGNIGYNSVKNGAMNIIYRTTIEWC